MIHTYIAIPAIFLQVRGLRGYRVATQAVAIIQVKVYNYKLLKLWNAEHRNCFRWLSDELDTIPL